MTAHIPEQPFATHKTDQQIVEQIGRIADKLIARVDPNQHIPAQGYVYSKKDEVVQRDHDEELAYSKAWDPDRGTTTHELRVRPSSLKKNQRSRTVMLQRHIIDDETSIERQYRMTTSSDGSRADVSSSVHVPGDLHGYLDFEAYDGSGYTSDLSREEKIQVSAKALGAIRAATSKPRIVIQPTAKSSKARLSEEQVEQARHTGLRKVLKS